MALPLERPVTELSFEQQQVAMAELAGVIRHRLLSKPGRQALINNVVLELANDWSMPASDFHYGLQWGEEAGLLTSYGSEVGVNERAVILPEHFEDLSTQSGGDTMRFFPAPIPQEKSDGTIGYI